jgi:hypothetical protein
MGWYETKERAEEAKIWKEKEYGVPFEVVEEVHPKLGSMWWANRIMK